MLRLPFLFGAVMALSQQPEPKPLAHTGSVDGYVTAAETRLPVRFAEIRLVPKPVDAPASLTQNLPAQDQSTGDRPQPHISAVSGISDMEGRFHLEGVPAGEYLAAAIMSGFAAPYSENDLWANDEQLKRLIAAISTVHVSEGGSATINLTLHRGGVITGRVLFSDGSPASGFVLSSEPPVQHAFNEGPRLPLSPLLEALTHFDNTTQPRDHPKTDDQGRYRIYGLSPGKYIVHTLLVAQAFPARVVMSDGSGFGGGSPNRVYPNLTNVYAPGVFRRTEARVFEIRGDEEITDADLKLDPSGLHSVKGRVLVGEDRHVPSQGVIQVRENGKLLDRMSSLEPDGSFEVDYLPSGTYTLVIMGFSDMITNASGSPQEMGLYQTAEQDLIVETHDVVLGDVVLVALKPGEQMRIPQ